MATSVPEPRASPRSAAARAGPSLTPSPTMATRRPSGLQVRDHRGLGRGQRPGDDLVDAGGGRHGLRGGRVVAGQQHRPQAQAAQPGDRRGGRGLDRVGDRERAAGLRRPSRPAPRCGPPAPSARHQAARSAGMVHAAVGEQPSRGRRSTSWPSTTPRAPRPGSAVKPSARGSGRQLGARPAALMAAATGVLGGLLHRAGVAEQVVAAGAGRGLDAGHRHRAGGDRAGLVQHHRVDRRGRTPAPGSP